MPTIKREILEFRDKCLIVKTTYLDNPHLPKEYVDSLLAVKATNPAYYTIYALGEFGSLDKLIYSNWKVSAFDKAQIQGALLIGLDFGYVNDETALVCSLLDEAAKKIYIYEE